MSILGYTSNEYTDERGREYYFDNAKFIIIMLVVIAHLTSPLKEDGKIMNAMWIFINAFHMPTLIFISGYFAKGYINKEGKIKYKRLWTYIIYYLGAQVTISLFEIFVLETKDAYISLVSPRSSLWYLMCLICWYLVLPLICNFDHKKVFIVAIVVALLMGYDQDANNVMSIMRVFNHFPFFLMGYYFKKEWIYKFRNKKTKICAVVVLAVLAVLIYILQDIIPTRIITSNYAYADSNLRVLYRMRIAWINRIGYYAVASIMGACVLLLIPRGKAIYTKLGSRTLQVYIIHRFLYLAELEYGWADKFMDMNYGGIIVILIAIVVTLILSLKIFEYPFIWLAKIQPMKLLAKKEKVESLQKDV